MAYMPFLGGKRICLGKTFAETTSKLIGPSIIHRFDFELVNKDHLINKPLNNTGNLVEPHIYVKIRERSTWLLYLR